MNKNIKPVFWVSAILFTIVFVIMTSSIKLTESEARGMYSFEMIYFQKNIKANSNIRLRLRCAIIQEKKTGQKFYYFECDDDSIQVIPF
jgi:hypothetical protein